MNDFIQINFNNIEEETNLSKIINQVLEKCYEVEKIDTTKIYINIILTNPEVIRQINKEYRNIDKETDVLSFPMFEKEELEQLLKKQGTIEQDILGDIIISIPKVIEQAKEYNHSFERELAYMTVHGFYHLMGYDHMEEEEKKVMRAKEENILEQLEINR